MKKSVLILFLTLNSICFFGQEILFQKVTLTDSVAIAKQMKIPYLKNIFLLNL